jgi:3-isopropylmalate/(R)-2-methylmalate dehydratase small subunit
MKITGAVMKFGDNVSTTIMAPLERMPDNSLETLKKFTMSAIRPNFINEVKPGMVIVAGANWGFGSQRELANHIFKDLGMKAIVADSVSRIYFRNSIAIGMPILPCRGVSKLFSEGDQIEVDFSNGTIRNLTTGNMINANALPESMLKILEKGGILSVLKEELQA